MKKITFYLTLPKIYLSFLLKRQKCGYLPIKLWIETTSRCNLECRLCANKDLPLNQKGDLSFELYKKIIDEAKNFVFDINLFHRGEPLLNKDLIKMIGYAENNNLKTRLHTNATILTQEISKHLILSGLDFISFSFDGYSKETYEKNRIGADFDTTLQNIINFLKIKKELKSKTPYTVIQIMEFDENLTTEDFKAQKISFINNFKNLPLNKIIIRKPHNWGGLIKIKDKNLADINLSNNIKGAGIKNKYKLTRKANITHSTCTFPWYSLTIFYDGKVYLCPQDFNGKILIGDVSKDSIQDIFNNELIQKVRLKFKNNNINDLSPCNKCDRILRKTLLGVPTEYLRSFLNTK